MSHYIFEKPGLFSDNPESEIVIANILAKWRKLEPNDFDFSQHFSQKGVLRNCSVILYCKFGIFRENFIFANSVKSQIC